MHFRSPYPDEGAPSIQVVVVIYIDSSSSRGGGKVEKRRKALIFLAFFHQTAGDKWGKHGNKRGLFLFLRRVLALFSGDWLFLPAFPVPSTCYYLIFSMKMQDQAAIWRGKNAAEIGFPHDPQSIYPGAGDKKTQAPPTFYEGGGKVMPKTSPGLSPDFFLFWRAKSN